MYSKNQALHLYLKVQMYNLRIPPSSYATDGVRTPTPLRDVPGVQEEGLDLYILFTENIRFERM
jgi:hypothetical protein